MNFLLKYRYDFLFPVERLRESKISVNLRPTALFFCKSSNNSNKWGIDEHIKCIINTNHLGFHSYQSYERGLKKS